MENLTFKTFFFRLYDRKIAEGSITFSQIGMSKNDFTKLCTEPDFVPDIETIERVCLAMRLTEEEEALLRRCDGILVLKDGRLAEMGRFDELMENKGYFYALYTVSQ